MSDIVERLRDTVTMLAVTPMNLSLEDWDRHANAIQDAAAFITRLRAEVKLILEERDQTFALMLYRAEKAEATNERLRAALEWALDNAGADHPSYPYRVPDDVWAKPYLVTGDCGGVGEEHFATALEAVEAAIAQEPTNDDV